MWPTLREQTHLKWNLHSLTFKISSFNLSFFLLGCVKARSHDSQVQPFSFFLFFREALWSKKYLGPIFVNSINGGILALTSSYTAYKWRIKGLPDYKSNESFWVGADPSPVESVVEREGKKSRRASSVWLGAPGEIMTAMGKDLVGGKSGSPMGCFVGISDLIWHVRAQLAGREVVPWARS